MDIRRIFVLSNGVDAFGTGLAGSLIPLFLVVSRDFGSWGSATAMAVGGVSELLGNPVMTYCVRRFGAQRILVWQLIGSAFCYFALCFSQSLIGVVLLLALSGLSRAGQGGLFFSLAIHSFGRQNALNMKAQIRSFRNVGYLVAGGVAAGLLSWSLETGTELALLFNGLSFLAIAIVAGRMKGAPRELILQDGESGVNESAESKITRSPFRDARYVALSLLAGLFSGTVFVFDVGLPLWIHETHRLPIFMIGICAVVNCLLVVLFQQRVAACLDNRGSERFALTLAGLCFFSGCVVVSLVPQASLPVAAGLLLLSVIAVTGAELFEGPAWWSLSIRMAPKDAADEYLTMFDFGPAALSIVYPFLIIQAVDMGTSGWFMLGLLIFTAGVLSSVIIGDDSKAT